MHANNQTGAIQPLEDLARITAEAGVVFHCDAVQTAGKLAIPPVRGFVTISAHKFHGPKGVGAMTVPSDIRLQTLVFGGGQERGIRSGAENVTGIAGLGVTAQAARHRLDGAGH